MKKTRSNLIRAVAMLVICMMLVSSFSTNYGSGRVFADEAQNEEVSEEGSDFDELQSAEDLDDLGGVQEEETQEPAESAEEAEEEPVSGEEEAPTEDEGTGEDSVETEEPETASDVERDAEGEESENASSEEAESEIPKEQASDAEIEESTDPVEAGSTEEVSSTQDEESLTETETDPNAETDPAAETEDDAEEQTKAMPAFSGEDVIDGVTITVSAPEGVFPEDAALQVSKVNKAEQNAVDRAVENVRDENVNVAVSYTFDIQVVDPDGNEIQPADGQKVKVSFSLEEVANQNLDTEVYHVSEEEGKLTAEVLVTSEEETTVTAETDGFSFYTVEFTYNQKQYNLNIKVKRG